MTTLRIQTNETFDTIVTVRESDPHSESIYVKFEMNLLTGGSERMDEMFLTPDHLEDIGKFMIEQANAIRKVQAARFLSKRTEKNAESGNIIG